MRLITSITNIELSAICNNTCQYCPAPEQHKHRPVGYMAWETFERCIEAVIELADRGAQKQVNLFGIGEPTLNPLFADMAEYARRMIPVHVPVHTNTNGKTMTLELAVSIRESGIDHIDITDHNAYDTVKAGRMLSQAGVRYGLSRDAVKSPNTWAGQVDWFAPEYRYPCQWINNGECMVMWDGRITTCCLDSRGAGIVGDIKHGINDIELKPYSLCAGCHQIPGG